MLNPEPQDKATIMEEEVEAGVALEEIDLKDALNVVRKAILLVNALRKQEIQAQDKGITEAAIIVMIMEVEIDVNTTQTITRAETSIAAAEVNNPQNRDPDQDLVLLLNKEEEREVFQDQVLLLLVEIEAVLLLVKIEVAVAATIVKEESNERRVFLIQDHDLELIDED